MRDPDGFVEFFDFHVKRTINSGISNTSFLSSELCIALVADGMLLPFKVESSNAITIPKVKFVTYPYEWSYSQLYDAASFTTKILKKTISTPYTMKDASAWNIIFDGCIPKFCDHLSFVETENNLYGWPAIGQFIRHFIMPLYISKVSKSFNSGVFFRLSYDGIDPAFVRALVGCKIFFSRIFFLMLGVSKSKLPQTSSIRIPINSKYTFEALEFFLNGLRLPIHQRSTWNNYVNERPHYSMLQVNEKINVVKNWAARLKPDVAMDLGCNTGEFSDIIGMHSNKVICLDSDPESINILYNKHKGDCKFVPIVTDLADVVGGTGFLGAEFPSFVKRFECASDCVFALAIVHHLAIGKGIRYDDIFTMIYKLTKEFAVIELIQHTDPMVVKLCNSYMRIPIDFNIELQNRVMCKYFDIIETSNCDDLLRPIYLLRKKSEVL